MDLFVNSLVGCPLFNFLSQHGLFYLFTDDNVNIEILISEQHQER